MKEQGFSASPPCIAILRPQLRAPATQHLITIVPSVALGEQPHANCLDFVGLLSKMNAQNDGDLRWYIIENVHTY